MLPALPLPCPLPARLSTHCPSLSLPTHAHTSPFRSIEREGALIAEYAAAHPDAAPAATIERPEDRREFRNLSKDDYRTSNHLLGYIAGFADLLASQ